MTAPTVGAAMTPPDMYRPVCRDGVSNATSTIYCGSSMGATPTKETILSSTRFPSSSNTSIFSLVPVFPPMLKPATAAFFAVPSVTTDSINAHMVLDVSSEITRRTGVGVCSKTILPLLSRTWDTKYGSIKVPPLNTAEMARTSCSGVSLKVWPKEPEVRDAVPHLSVSVTRALSKKTPLLSPARSMPVFSKMPKFFTYS